MEKSHFIPLFILVEQANASIRMFHSILSQKMYEELVDIGMH